MNRATSAYNLAASYIKSPIFSGIVPGITELTYGPAPCVQPDYLQAADY